MPKLDQHMEYEGGSTQPLQEPLIHKHKRLLERSSPFFQSSGAWNVERKRPRGWRAMYLSDTYHTLVNMPTVRSMALICALYVATFFGFAMILWLAPDSCNVPSKGIWESYIFSLESLMTIGYGTTDIFFGNCAYMSIGLTVGCLLTILLDALCIGLFFARFSRAQTRAVTVIFSNNAVLRKIRGKVYFMFQVCEMRKHQLIEAHVRCYAVLRFKNKTSPPLPSCNGCPAGVHCLGCTSTSHETLPDTIVQSRFMRLQHPDDELGGVVLLSLPSIVVHRVDGWSPFIANPDAAANCGDPAPRDPILSVPTERYRFPDILQRSGDADALCRDAYVCGVCGTGFSTFEQWRMHSHYSTEDDRVSGHTAETACSLCGETFPSAQHVLLHFRSQHDEVGHADATPGLASESHHHEAPTSGGPHDDFSTEQVLQNLDRLGLEVVVLVEGIDAPTSCTVQARHSYTASEILLDHTFAPCVHERGGSLEIDFGLFHTVMPAPDDSVCPNAVPCHA